MYRLDFHEAMAINVIFNATFVFFCRTSVNLCTSNNGWFGYKCSVMVTNSDFSVNCIKSGWGYGKYCIV